MGIISMLFLAFLILAVVYIVFAYNNLVNLKPQAQRIQGLGEHRRAAQTAPR